MKVHEIRKKFLTYFNSNGHTIVESSSLVPHNDPTLLFTSAGMVPFKDVFTGKEKKPFSRATSSQKCVRAGGKHNDLENVGFTARHHTFFEMLGNFSFGDYFKKEAIRFAWEFTTQILKLPKDRLYVTVFETDDEAAEIWAKQEGVPVERIYRFGEKDNFWSMGDTGPCGPCSELFYDRGEKYGCGKPTCQMGCDCDRYTEFWNLVFMQYDRDTSGKLTPLPKPSVDTGAGLERLALILQNAESNYDTDVFSEILKKIETLSGKKYTPHLGSDYVSFRVIADHARAATFLIGDGVLPSNEGRGYVLRRIMRRAIRHGKKLGLNKPFLNQVVLFVIDEMKSAYPDLIEKKSFIEKVVLAEEEQFLKTLTQGLEILDEEIKKLSKGAPLPGDIAFKLYDTFGFPLDLTEVICSEKKIAVDHKGFQHFMEKQKEESRKHWKGSGAEATEDHFYQILDTLKKVRKTCEFHGYQDLVFETECTALLVQKENTWVSVTSVSAEDLKNQNIKAVFHKTPFYPEGGGQVGDRGWVTSSRSFKAEVLDTKKPLEGLIISDLKLIHGSLKVSDKVHLSTDTLSRSLTARNHTATHLLHWALREVLGPHIKQAGSLVTPDFLRFDFTHFQALTESEIETIENKINDKIWRNDPVKKELMTKEKAVAQGAIAFFGEKYGDEVRVINVGDYSVELCGGTHVNSSGELHIFKIMNENGIASGVRRIMASTSQGAFETLRNHNTLLSRLKEMVKASSVDEIASKIEKMTETEKILRKQIADLNTQNQGSFIETLLGNSEKINDTYIIVSEYPTDAGGVKVLRELSDRILNMLKMQSKNGVIVFGMNDPDLKKVFLLTASSPNTQKSASAQTLLKELLPFIDGKGGGKADCAQAGGTKMAGLSEALDKAPLLIKKLLAENK